MNPAKFDQALVAVERYLRGRRDVPTAILFGSVARGTATPDSDLDMLLVLIDHRGEKTIFSDLFDVTAALDVRVAPLFVAADLHQLDRQLLDSILRHGKVLKGVMPDVTVRDLALRPVYLVRYSLRGLSQREKVRLNRTLLGYRTRKVVGRRKYRSESLGLLRKVGGELLGRGALLVPEADLASIDEILRSYGGQRIAIPLWRADP